MPRTARIVIPGVPHHVTQRGNRGEPVFLREGDYAQYLTWLAEYAEASGLAVSAYCLMPNHIHLVATPTEESGLAGTLQALHARYAQTINRREGWTGHLWQGRHYSCPLDDAHLHCAVRYVERNPVRAGLTKQATDYRWSSAAAHCGLWPADVPLTGPAPDVDDWPAFLSDDEEDAVRRLRERTHSGLPCGDEDFVRRLESLTGRQLVPGKRGRPRRAPDK